MKNCKIIKEKLYVDYMYKYNVCVMYKVLQLASSCQKKNILFLILLYMFKMQKQNQKSKVLSTYILPIFQKHM